MSTYSKKKDFKDLSLLDAFLFALATENPQNAELIEPNTYEEKYLEKRSRYYLSLTDTKYLGKFKSTRTCLIFSLSGNFPMTRLVITVGFIQSKIWW